MTIKQIMLVDDSEAEHFLSKRLIKSYDDSIEVLSAYDGRDALELIEKTGNPPEIILLDINMPRMSGMEFLYNFSKLYESSSVRIAMFSSSLQEQDEAYKYKCVCYYFEKPLRDKHLDAILENMTKMNIDDI